MTLKEFKKNGFIVGKPFEVEGKMYWIEKSRNGFYFNAFIGGKQITRATKETICKLIEKDCIS